MGIGISKLLKNNKKWPAELQTYYNIFQNALYCYVDTQWEVWVSIRCMMLRSWYWHRYLFIKFLVSVSRPGDQSLGIAFLKVLITGLVFIVLVEEDLID